MGALASRTPIKSETKIFVNENDGCTAGGRAFAQHGNDGADTFGALTVVTRSVCGARGVPPKALCVLRGGNIASALPRGRKIHAKLILPYHKINVLVSVKGVCNAVAVSVNIHDVTIFRQSVC